MNLSELINRMIATGMSAGEAGSIAAEIYAAGVASAASRSSNAERQQRYRDRKRRNETVTNRNASVTERNEDHVTQTVTNRNETVTSNASDKTPLTKNSNSKNSKRQNRGTRIAPDWSPSDAERAFAKQEGFSDFEVQREADKFRGYWVACAGSKAVKLNWSLTWENWVRRSAESAGKAPTSRGPVPTASDELNWDQILQTYKKIGIWSKWAGPDLTSPACRAPREMLEKYGLVASEETLQ